MRIGLLCITCVFALFGVARALAAADGDLDPGFGSNGQVTIVRPQNQTSSSITGDVGALADGRFLWAQATGDFSVFVGRGLADGSADTNFGGDHSGRVTLTGCARNANTRLIGYNDGSAVVWAGACLLRVDANGSVDASFGTGAQPPSSFVAAGLLASHSGGFVLAGMLGSQWQVYRFAANGTLDASFGSSGGVSVTIPSTNNLLTLEALALRDDDRIVLAGSRGNTHGPNLVVAQLSSAGAPDPAWNTTGIVDIEAPSGYQTLYASALRIDRDGSVIVGGRGSNGSVACCLMLTRLDASGQVMPAFGLRIFPLAGVLGMYSFFENRDALAVLPHGRILFVTTTFPSAVPQSAHRTQFTLVRTLADGNLDNTFGNNGWRGFTIADPSASGQAGDYVQAHALAYANGSALLFGRTFFEDNSNGLDYVTLARARFDDLFADGIGD
ncbi:MAG: hypothetical protein ABI451_09920 [Dokdonella sp.]